MTKVNVILVLIMINFYTKISGAQSLDVIDFEMWVQLLDDIILMPKKMNSTALRMSEKIKNLISTSFLSSRVQQLSKQIGGKLLDIAETVTKRSEVQEVRMQFDNFVSTFYVHYFSRDVFYVYSVNVISLLYHLSDCLCASLTF